ncbi:MAG: YdcF family protein [Alphaproteobacteria bacterium]
MHALAKLVGFLIEPVNAVTVLLVTGLVLATLRRRRPAAAALGAAAVLFLSLTLTPLPEWLMRSLEERFPPTPYDVSALAGAVVLGGATGDGALAAARDTYLLGDPAERLTAAAGLRRRHPDLVIVISGFSGAVRHQGLSEGEMTRRLMAELGLAPESFHYEERSRTTHENARYTAARFARDGRWLLVTSAFHMPRAVAAFRAQGVEVVPYPVDWRAPELEGTRWLRSGSDRLIWARLAIKEWVGLAAYRALGRTDTLLPTPDPVDADVTR